MTEFWRQVGSSKLKKINPNLECIFKHVPAQKLPYIKVEYTNNSIWETEIIPTMKNSNLRYEFFSRAELVGDGEEGEINFDQDDESIPEQQEEEEEVAPAKDAKKKPAAPAAGKGGKK